MLCVTEDWSNFCSTAAKVKAAVTVRNIDLDDLAAEVDDSYINSTYETL